VREKQDMRVYENKILRNTLEPRNKKRGIKLYEEELCDLYSSPVIYLALP
jgi:hypothetical protein